MRAWPLEKRDNALADLKRGLSLREVADSHGISVSTIGRWALRERQGLSLEPKKTGRPSLLPVEQEQVFVELVDLLSVTMKRKLLIWVVAVSQGQYMSPATFRRHSRRLGLPKKSEEHGVLRNSVQLQAYIARWGPVVRRMARQKVPKEPIVPVMSHLLMDFIIRYWGERFRSPPESESPKQDQSSEVPRWPRKVKFPSW